LVLPRAGYKITSNSLDDETGEPAAAIDFTGHGYEGTISSVSYMKVQGDNLGNGKNIMEILLSPK
jgi:hypothetical protein